MKKFFVSAAAFLCAGLFVCAQNAAKGPDNRALYQEGSYYVTLKNTVPAAKSLSANKTLAVEKVECLQRVAENFGLHKDLQSMGVFNHPVLSRTFLVKFDSTARSAQLFNRLLEMPEVEKVERVSAHYIASAAGAGSAAAAKDGSEDPLYGIKNNFNYSWHLDMIHAEEAWSLQTADSKIKVAVVDNAIWGDHPDLQIPVENRYNVYLKNNKSEPLASAQVSQTDQCDNLNSCYSFNWSHGTHTAGAIGAINNNGVGIKSMGGGVSILAIACPSPAKEGLVVEDGFAGIAYAAEHGADVISVSWGGYVISETEKALIASCIDNGIVFVAAAGNNGVDNMFYPAALPGVISIAAVNSNGILATWGNEGSNYGNWVCLAAPGGYYVNNGVTTFNCILSTTYSVSQNYRMKGHLALNGQYYDGMYGTSMATPVVSGLCGLILSADSTLNSYQMRELLMASSQAMPEAARGIQAGGGIVDAAAALKLLKNSLPAPRNVKVERPDGCLKINVSWEAPEAAKGRTLTGYEIYCNGKLVKSTEPSVLEYHDSVGVRGGIFRYGIKAVYGEERSLRACMDIDVPEMRHVAVSVKPEGCSREIKGLGDGYYPAETVLNLETVPRKGCTFVRWMEDDEVLARTPQLEYKIEYAETVLQAVYTGTPDYTAVENYKPAWAVRVYPNPAAGRITVKGENMKYVEIYNAAGLLVARENAAGGELNLDVSGFAPGLYFVKAFGAQAVSTARFVKQ